MSSIDIIKDYIDNADNPVRLSISYPDKYRESFINYYSQHCYSKSLRRELIIADNSTINKIFRDYYQPEPGHFRDMFYELISIFLIRNLSLHEIKSVFSEIEPLKVRNSKNQYKIKAIKDKCPIFGKLVFSHLGNDYDDADFYVGSFLRDLFKEVNRYQGTEQGEFLLEELESIKGLPDVQLSFIESRLFVNDFDEAVQALERIREDYRFRGYRSLVIWLAESNRFKELNRYIKKVDKRKEKRELSVMYQVVAYHYARFNGIESAVKKYPDEKLAVLLSLIGFSELNEIYEYINKYLKDEPGGYEFITYDLFKYYSIKLNSSNESREVLISILDQLLNCYLETDFENLDCNKRYLYDSFWRLGMKYIEIGETKELPKIYKMLKGSKNKKYLKEEVIKRGLEQL